MSENSVQSDALSDCIDIHLRESCRQSMDTTGNHLNARRIANVHASFRKETMFSKNSTSSMQISTLISLLSAHSLSSFVLHATWYSDGELRHAEVAYSQLLLLYKYHC